MNSKFSLCAEIGSGPNSIRFWESLVVVFLCYYQISRICPTMNFGIML